MNSTDQPFWTLEDYQRFLQHPDQFPRKWAAYRIEAQYPEKAAELFVPLLIDENHFLPFKAAQEIGKTRDVRFEDDLLAALPHNKGSNKREIMVALGQISSPKFLPELVRMVDAVDLSQALLDDFAGVTEALSYYAQGIGAPTLWRFAEQYSFDDLHMYHAFKGLLLHPQPDTIPRLLSRYSGLKPGEFLTKGLDVFAEVAGVGRLAEEVENALDSKRTEDLPDIFYGWMGMYVPISASFYKALRPRLKRMPDDLAGRVFNEIAPLMKEMQPQTDQWMVEWRQGIAPTGFRWRMLCAFQTITELARMEGRLTKLQKREAGALSLAFMAQALVDEDDETILASAQTEEVRKTALLDILNSPRQNIVPDISTIVIELGPDVFPQLLDLLEENYTEDIYWPLLRILEILTPFTHKYHPSYDSEAIELLMDILMEDMGNNVNEAVHHLLVAIGPPIVDPVAERLGEMTHFDIYTTGALTEIPTEASLKVALSLVEGEDFDEWDVEKYMDFGHPRVFDLYKEIYDQGDLERSLRIVIPEGLYTFCLLNNMNPPELETWKEMAYEAEIEIADFLEKFKIPGGFLPQAGEEEDDFQGPLDESRIGDIISEIMSQGGAPLADDDMDGDELSDEDAYLPIYSPPSKERIKKEKRKRKQAKNQRKQQRKQKKKKR